MNTELILRAWALIGDAAPMKTDCGAICGATCCLPDDDGKGGVCLLPGEESLIGAPAWARVSHDPDMTAAMIECEGKCDRNLRPFLCRVFPLCPVRGKSGWTVRMDARARAVCPLASGGLRSLDPDFVRRCAHAVQIIAADPEGEAFLKRWADMEARFRAAAQRILVR